MSIFELISIASIAPFMAIVSDTSLINESPLIHKIYNYFNFKNDNDFMIFLSLIVFSLFIVSVIVSLFTTWRLLRYSQKVGAEISISLFSHYLNQDWLFHSKNSSNEFSRKIFEEVKRLTGGIIQPLLHLNNKLILTSFMVVALLFYNFNVAIITLIIFGIFYLSIFLLLRKKLYINSVEISNLNKNRYNLIGEAFGGIKELIINNNFFLFLNQFSSSNTRFAYTSSNNQAMAQLPKFIAELVAIGSVLFLIIYLLILNNSGLNKLLPTLAVFGIAGFKILPAFQQIFASIATIKGNISAFNSIKQELSTAKKQNSQASKILKVTFDDFIKIDNLSYQYDSKKSFALKKINLVINKYSKTGIVGKTGSGKSTLIDILTGLVHPSEGLISVDMQKIKSENAKGWRENIAYIPQNIFLFDTTVLENITFSNNFNEIDMNRFKKAIEVANINEFINTLNDDFNSKIGQRGVQLSGGQRQRIGIARALYQDKPLLIFDEATSSLDSETEKNIINSILDTYKDKTVINITHRVENLIHFDKIIVLDDSQIINSGTFEELSKDVKFKNLLAY
tara:strand:+ start:7000 stop:8697 length:1698 start_codon:yes stop_codon:yes gene_type:complete